MIVNSTLALSSSPSDSDSSQRPIDLFAKMISDFVDSSPKDESISLTLNETFSDCGSELCEMWSDTGFILLKSSSCGISTRLLYAVLCECSVRAHECGCKVNYHRFTE
jgi:hypothetical protein